VPQVSGKTLGGFGVYLVDRQDIRMPDGQVLTGFDFIGWREDTGIRVQVFALVPKVGVANKYLPGGDSHNLTRRQFASYLVRPDESRAITEMKALGIEPMVLRSVVRPASR
jgi:ABC-type phosphate/phosphonate transport system ATPase subunit